MVGQKRLVFIAAYQYRRIIHLLKDCGRLKEKQNYCVKDNLGGDLQKENNCIKEEENNLSADLLQKENDCVKKVKDDLSADLLKENLEIFSPEIPRIILCPDTECTEVLNASNFGDHMKK